MIIIVVITCIGRRDIVDQDSVGLCKHVSWAVSNSFSGIISWVIIFSQTSVKGTHKCLDGIEVGHAIGFGVVVGQDYVSLCPLVPIMVAFA